MRKKEGIERTKRKRKGGTPRARIRTKQQLIRIDNWNTRENRIVVRSMRPNIPFQSLRHVKMCRTWVLLRHDCRAVLAKYMWNNEMKVFCLWQSSFYYSFSFLTLFFHHKIKRMRQKLTEKNESEGERIAFGKYVCKLLLLLIMPRSAISHTLLTICVCLCVCQRVVGASAFVSLSYCMSCL